MNPNDIHYLANGADRDGNIGDVLQVFVHDFTLRQGAGEAKVREVERKIGGVTGELFILRKLFQDFQTRVNDDHDLIMRLQHEIEALRSRVKTLDSKHTTTEAQSGRLDIRIEQLREQLNRTCEDTDQNVGRLLSNFARSHLVAGNASRLHNTTSANRGFVQRNISEKAEKGIEMKKAEETETVDYTNHETRELPCDKEPQQCSVTSPSTFQSTTTEVSNEEFPANNDYHSVEGVHTTAQPHALCNESPSEDGGLQQASTPDSSLEVVENNISEDENHHSFPDVSNINPSSSSSINLNDNDSEATIASSQPINTCSPEDVESNDTTTPKLPSEVTPVGEEISQDATEQLPKANEMNEVSNEISKPSEPTTSPASTKKNKSKRSSRGRKRKNSQNTNTENQEISEEKEKQTPSSVNEEQVHSQNIEVQSASGEQVDIENMREHACNLDSAAHVSNDETPLHAEENSLSQNTNGVTYPECPENQISFQETEEQISQLHEEQPLFTEEPIPSASVEEHTPSLQSNDQVSPTLDTEEDQLPQTTAEVSLQCSEEENSEVTIAENLPHTQEDAHSKHAEVQTSLHFSENIDEEVPSQELEGLSPKSKRRVTFHVEEIDDDEIPDLSYVEETTEDEIDQSRRKENEHQPDMRVNQGPEKTEVEHPSPQSTRLQTPCPRLDVQRMESGEEEQKDDIVGMCANCGFLAKLRCGNCRQAFYCKRECQKDHWKTTHKDQCRPYQVLTSAELGRYMVASRDLKAGDIILKDDPLVVGPKQITEPICLGCYKRVDGSYRCQKCHWPLCGPLCEKSVDHQPECVVGMEIGSPIEISNFDEPNHFYEVVFPLRCLALKKKAPKKYEQLLSLDSHYEDRKGSHVFKENQKSIVNILRNYFFLQQFPIEDIDSSEKSIHNVTGIIDVNALELRLPESEVLGLFPNFAMMEHSCTPNTKHTFSDDNRQVILKAAVDIKRGEHLSTMYTHILWGTSARRDHLKHSKYFMCTCFRCSDPTELGTNFSTLRCNRCTNGFMLSAAPLDELADWICTTCNETIKNEEVTDINLKIGEEVEKVLATPSVPSLEELIQKHAKTSVHPNHYHLFATRHTLLQMYGRDPSYANEDYMKKKERMCQDFLKVCTALDPGMSRLAPYAGVALYEYHLAVLSRTRQDPGAKQTDPAALKKDVETAKALLQQCIKVLQDEPKDQLEGQLCHVAQQNLIELRQWEANLFSP